VAGEEIARAKGDLGVNCCIARFLRLSVFADLLKAGGRRSDAFH